MLFFGNPFFTQKHDFGMFWTFYFFAPLGYDTLESHCYFFICLIAVDNKQEKKPSQSS